MNVFDNSGATQLRVEDAETDLSELLAIADQAYMRGARRACTQAIEEIYALFDSRTG